MRWNSFRNLMKTCYNPALLWQHGCKLSTFSDHFPPLSRFQFQDLTSFYSHNVPKRIHTSTRLDKKTPGAQKSKKNKDEVIDLEEFSDIFEVDSFMESIEQVESSLSQHFASKLVLRPSLFTFEEIEVELDGETLTLNTVAQISMTQTHVSIQPVDWEHADVILDALRINYPQSSATKDETKATITVGLMKVTKEYRQNLTEKAKKAVASAKDDIKTAVNKSLKQVKKAEGFDEDTIHDAQQELYAAQKIMNKKLDDLLKTKTQQLMHD